jgi:hypothetical protein
MAKVSPRELDGSAWSLKRTRVSWCVKRARPRCGCSDALAGVHSRGRLAPLRLFDR